MMNSVDHTEVDVWFSITFYRSRSLGDTYLMTLDAIVQLQYEGLCFHSICSCVVFPLKEGMILDAGRDGEFGR